MSNLEELLTIKPVMNFLNMNTYTANIQGLEEALDLYKNLAKQMGFEARLCGKADGHNRVVEIRPNGAKSKKPKLGFVVHLDTVPAEDDWKHNPLGEIVNGRVYGRGIIDDKGPAIQILQVLYMMKDYIQDDWCIICGSSEEAEWIDMEAYKAEMGENLPEFSITIDGDGVQNGCRGYLDLKLTFERNGTTHIISNFATPEGAANNSVPGLTTAKINGKELNYEGKACHSSIPQNGKNAITGLAKKIKEENPSAYEEFKGFFDLMEIMHENYDASKTLFFEEKPSELNGQDIGYTSACPTTCEVKGDELTVNLNIRLMIGTTEKEIKNAIDRICKQYGCKAEISEGTLPGYVPVNLPQINNMLQAYENILGKKTTSEIAGGAGYNAALPNCIIAGPRWAIAHDEEDTCHAADESRTIKDMVLLMNMLMSFLAMQLGLQEIKRINRKLLEFQANRKKRTLITRNTIRYSQEEINIMAEMLINPNYNPNENKLKNEQKVICNIRRFVPEKVYTLFTPEQLSFIVNETIVSHKLCNTNFSLEQFIEVSPIISLLISRYNIDRAKATGLVKDNGQLKDKAILSALREIPFSTLEKYKLEQEIRKEPNFPKLTEKQYVEGCEVVL